MGHYILSISRPPKRILYPIHIQAPKKDIISYPYPGPKKRIWIYILYPLSKFLPALSQFLNTALPGKAPPKKKFFKKNSKK
jgi:hypothetical protein